MFLSIAAEGEGAENLSFIVQKMPGKVFQRDNLTAFYPVYEDGRANLIVFCEFPDYKLWNADTPDADAYVTSREYCLSSLFCRELKNAFNTAINGSYKTEEDKKMAETQFNFTIEALPLTTKLTPKDIVQLFRPLGYDGITPIPEIDPNVPHGDASNIGFESLIVDHSSQALWQPQKTKVYGLTLKCKKTIKEILRQLLVLIPVIDNYSHYSDLEPLIAELTKYGEGWLDSHPKKEFIRSRFLRHKRDLITKFEKDKKPDAEEELEKRVSLQSLRIKWFSEEVKKRSARSVVDAGCGSGRLAEALVKDGVFEVSAFDCAPKAVFTAKKFLAGKANVSFSSLMYYDPHFRGKDSICLQEVIEHMTPWRLEKAKELIFGSYEPKFVLMTTPNRAYNTVFGLAPTEFRHGDHKFEFLESEAMEFGNKVVEKWPKYKFSLAHIGAGWKPPVGDPIAIAPTFGLVFEKLEAK